MGMQMPHLDNACTNHNAAIGHIQNSKELKHHQHQDKVICQLHNALSLLQSHVTFTGYTWRY